MTSSVETKEGRVNNFIHASIIAVCVPGRDQSCFILRLFTFFVLNNVPFCQYSQLRHTHFREFFVLAKLVRALVRAPIRSPNCVFINPFQVQQERKTAGRLASRPRPPYNAGFVGELAGKRVCHGNCGSNPQTAGHLGCLELLANQGCNSRAQEV